MQRKATKNTRGPNAIEKAFQGWLKEQPCAYCGKPGPSIVDHARGATFRHNKELVGHAFCTSKCEQCDSYKTNGSHNKHFEMTGKVESIAWYDQASEWWHRTGNRFDDECIAAMSDFIKVEQRRYAA